MQSSNNTNSFFNLSIAVPRSEQSEQPLTETKQSGPAPTVNYIWIGPPSSIPGHDIGGPIAMAEANKDNPLIFWCLEAYASEYEKKFQGHNIRVCSIESEINKALNSDSPDLAQSAQRLKNIYATCLNGENRDSVRDRVTFKDAASLFLLQSVGGYVLDTNVIPLEQKPIFLPAQDMMHVPGLHHWITESAHLECWMMYAPRENNDIPKELLKMYHENWQRIEKKREKLMNSELYFEELGTAIINPIYQLFCQRKIITFKTRKHKESLYIDIPEWNLRKTYSNTHRDDIVKLPEIFYLVSANNIPQLRIYIQYKGDVNKALTEQEIESRQGLYKGETALHLAMRSRCDPELIKMLLDAGADFDAEVTYSKHSKTARSLLESLAKTDKRYLPILEEFSLKRRKTL